MAVLPRAGPGGQTQARSRADRVCQMRDGGIMPEADGQAATGPRGYGTTAPLPPGRQRLGAQVSHGSVGKESTCNAGDPSLVPGSRRSTGEGMGYPLKYSWASLVAQLVENPPAMQET